MYEHLCQPLSIGKMALRNRMVMPPMVVRYASEDGYITNQTIKYYESRAKGGAALIIQEATYIHPQGQIMAKEPGISDDKFVPGLCKVVDTIHRHGAKAAIQLVHGGRMSSSALTGVQPVAPSPIPAPGIDVPRELNTNEIAEIINYFVLAALRAKSAGFDGVEIHGAHGYLIDQFISRSSNKRNDSYGGNLVNRTRLLTQVIQAVKENLGPDYPVWCRIDGKEFSAEEGITLEEAKEVARMAQEAGAVAINVTATGSMSPVNANAAIFTPAVIVDLAAGIKESVSVPVIAVGKMTPEAGEKALKEGKADLIAFGRTLFADPELPNKVCENNVESIRPCILCLRCRDGRYSKYDIAVECSVNAETGKEGQYQITPADKPRKVLVIGGGPAGMEAARVAALRGHHVSLWEKEASLGGQLKAATVAPYKDRVGQLTDYLMTQLKTLGVDVELNREANSDSIINFAPEVVVLATGVRQTIPEIPGLDASHPVDAVSVLEKRVAVGNQVVVIGAELVACEVADFLTQQGKKVSILRRGPEVALKVGPSIRNPLINRLEKQGVTMLTGVTYHQVEDNKLTITTQDGTKRTLEADTIVLAAGTVPNQELYQEIKGKVAEVKLAGDCVSPRNIHAAITEGYEAGLEI